MPHAIALAGKTLLTQFGRALDELGITLAIAKGCVECENAALQAGLMKEMSLAGIASIKAANACLDRFFLEDPNRRYALAPTDS